MEICRRIFSVRNNLFGYLRPAFRQKPGVIRFRPVSRNGNAARKLIPALPILSQLPVVKAWGFGSSNSNEDKSPAGGNKSERQKLLETADELYSTNEINMLYDLLVAHKDKDDDEILWRLARAASDKCKVTESVETKKALHYEGFGYVKRALEINKNNYAVHKWYAILLDYTGGYEGTKQRISNAYHVKEHFLRAIELNPKDATSIYSLGYWCFLFADLAWYEKKIASMIFSTPPSSSYEEALGFFLNAEKTDPNFYSMNLLMLGKTYSRLKDTKQAILYLTKAKDYPVVTEDDKKAHKEAIELLKSLGIKDVE